MYTQQYIDNIIAHYNNAKNNGSISDKNKYTKIIEQIKTHNKTHNKTHK